MEMEDVLEVLERADEYTLEGLGENVYVLLTQARAHMAVDLAIPVHLYQQCKDVRMDLLEQHGLIENMRLEVNGSLYRTVH